MVLVEEKHRYRRREKILSRYFVTKGRREKDDT